MTTLPQPLVVFRETLVAGRIRPYSDERQRRHEETTRNVERWLVWNQRYHRATGKTADPPAWVCRFKPSFLAFLLRRSR